LLRLLGLFGEHRAPKQHFGLLLLTVTIVHTHSIYHIERRDFFEIRFMHVPYVYHESVASALDVIRNKDYSSL